MWPQRFYFSFLFYSRNVAINEVQNLSLMVAVCFVVRTGNLFLYDSVESIFNLRSLLALILACAGIYIVNKEFKGQ